MPGAGDIQGSHIRASDDDRGQVADELRGHCAAGRITIDELDDRVGRAMTARTLGDLAELTADLPSDPSTAGEMAEASAVEVAVTGGSARGVRPFTIRAVVPAPPEHTRGLALEALVPVLTAYGFQMSTETTTLLAFRKDGNRTLAIVLAVMFFPIGLIALAFNRQEQVTVSLERDGQHRTALIIHGVASRRVRRYLAELPI